MKDVFLQNNVLEQTIELDTNFLEENDSLLSQCYAVRNADLTRKVRYTIEYTDGTSKSEVMVHRNGIESDIYHIASINGDTIEWDRIFAEKNEPLVSNKLSFLRSYLHQRTIIKADDAAVVPMVESIKTSADELNQKIGLLKTSKSNIVGIETKVVENYVILKNPHPMIPDYGVRIVKCYGYRPLTKSGYSTGFMLEINTRLIQVDGFSDTVRNHLQDIMVLFDGNMFQITIGGNESLSSELPIMNYLKLQA